LIVAFPVICSVRRLDLCAADYQPSAEQTQVPLSISVFFVKDLVYFPRRHSAFLDLLVLWLLECYS
jgi:hypothetical protein